MIHFDVLKFDAYFRAVILINNKLYKINVRVAQHWGIYTDECEQYYR